MSPKDRKELTENLDRAGMLQPGLTWKAQPGPQEEAYFSQADILLYGGAAGGGKTDLIIGLGLNEHTRVGIFRQQAGEMTGMIDRMNAILEDANKGSITGNPPKWDGPNDKKFEFGHLERPRSERSWQGRDHDLKAFDEAAQMSPQKILFVMGWNRSTKENQRCRVLLASNPPMGGDGAYLLEWFGPWLDPLHELYGTVKPGDLLWAVFVGEGEEVRTVWCNGPEPVEIEGVSRTPKSRTFIPARMGDNKYLGEDYRATIDQMPEPMRTALLTGDFMAGQTDHEWQVIPSEWVDLAFDRYDQGIGKSAPMDVIGVDIAQGGPDKTTLCPLHGTRFEEPIIRKGVDTKDGADVGSLVIKERRDNAHIEVDGTGGWGGDTVGFLKRENRIDVGVTVFSEASGGHAKDTKMPFLNKRAELIWRFREALHPKSGENLAIPRSQKTRAELTTPRWELSGRSIKIESKDDIRKRIGSSTDILDGMVIAWGARSKAAMKRAVAAQESQSAVFDYDPLAEWDT